MTAVRWTWIVVATVWTLFFSWYTSFGGPLTDEEIEQYLSQADSMVPAPAPEQIDQLRRFMQEDTGDDFVMINIGEEYDQPLQIEGVEPGQSTEQVLANYMAYVWPALLSRASHPVQFGTAASTAIEVLNADGMEVWDNTVSMRYRSRRDFMDFVSDPRMPPAHAFKVASIKKTIVFPADPWFHLGDPRLVLGLLLGLIGCVLSWRFAVRAGSNGPIGRAADT
jgi:hypothetical protein